MKSASKLDPSVAFPDAKQKPDDDQLKAALGAAFRPLGAVFAAVAKQCPDATAEWQYSKQAGWYRVALLKKRRLFYVIPKKNAFRLSLILGGKAIDSLKSGPFAAEIERRLKTAKRYPEGIAFDSSADSCDPALTAAMLTAKIAH